MRVAIGCDHAGFELKEAVKGFLVSENSEVLDEGRQRHLERRGQFANGRWALAQPLQHPPPGGIGKRPEDAVDGLERSSCGGHSRASPAMTAPIL